MQLDEILHFLVAKSAAPSTFGAQLDRMKYGVHITPDPIRAQAEAESSMLQQATLIRCVDDFAARQDFGPSYKQLTKIQRYARDVPQGYIAIGILRSYHEWASQRPERALVAVYQFLAKIAPDYVPDMPEGETDILDAFLNGKAKRARAKAAEAYADALIALQSHVTAHNKRNRKKG